ncbi:MAG: hypothetical protein K2M27_02980 [Muribaculaceae bacterium]|nr:hypothetical protein [Muribaculaceae bacterium]
MKKLLYSFAAIPLLLFGACSADEGTEPGTDSYPAVTVYSYQPSDPDLNPDNDITVRFATNSAAREVYYLVEKSDDVRSFIKDNGEDAYVKRIIENGEKFSVDGADSKDINVIDQHGEVMISAVASNGTPGKRNYVTFVGLDWEDVLDGTFYIQQSFIGTQSTLATLQVCTTDESLYRVNNAFGEGYPVKLELLDAYGEDADGVYQLFRVPEANTPFSVNLSSGGPYELWIQDIGYWQGNASFVTSVSGYENGIYEDKSAFFQFAWMAGNIGCVSYTTPSYFIPD